VVHETENEGEQSCSSLLHGPLLTRHLYLLQSKANRYPDFRGRTDKLNTLLYYKFRAELKERCYNSTQITTKLDYLIQVTESDSKSWIQEHTNKY
jgi:hypothetical protein